MVLNYKHIYPLFSFSTLLSGIIQRIFKSVHWIIVFKTKETHEFLQFFQTKHGYFFGKAFVFVSKINSFVCVINWKFVQVLLNKNLCEWKTVICHSNTRVQYSTAPCYSSIRVHYSTVPCRSSIRVHYSTVPCYANSVELDTQLLTTYALPIQSHTSYASQAVYLKPRLFGK